MRMYTPGYQENFYPPEKILRCLKTFLMVTTIGWRKKRVAPGSSGDEARGAVSVLQGTEQTLTLKKHLASRVHHVKMRNPLKRQTELES